MCNTCGKSHSGACSQKDMSPREKLNAILSGVEGVRTTQEDQGKRINSLEKKLKSRGISLPGVEDEKQKFSIQRAVMAIISGRHELAPFEMDVMKETKKRDQSTIDDSLGGFLVPTEALPDFIDFLRAKQIVKTLGATSLTGLRGSPVQIPKQKGAATALFLGEGAAITSSDLQFGQVEMRPHEAAALVVLSSRLLSLSNPGAEQIINNDIAIQLALLIDKAALRGGAAQNEPIGILNTTDVNISAAFGAVTIDKLYDLMLRIEEDNADQDRMGWAMSPRTWNSIRKLKDGESRFFFNPQPHEKTRGTLLGFPVMTTTQIPNNLGAGSDESELYFGVWSELVQGEWGGLELLASRETNDAFAKNQVHIRAIMEVDNLVRHPESFVVATGVSV